VSGSPHDRFVDDDLADFSRVIGVSLFGTMVGMRAAGRHMRDKRRGVIFRPSRSRG
jgi:NAD(P)-dependent dehydrogenase (short-subunit alcohol dehydrogenase family)